MKEKHNMAKVSIIVPVYNAQKYIKRCVESIISQKENDIEVILIDDGSSDNSLKILEELKKRDKRINVYTQENKGRGYTRNRGVLTAKGDYIMFVDADDWIEENTISTMLEYVEKYGTNYVRCACMKEIFQTGRKINTDIIYEYPEFVEKEDYKEKIFNTFLDTYFLNSPCLFIVKREFLIRNDIFFDIGSFYAEDLVFNLKIFMKLDNAVFLPYTFYHYMNNEENVITKLSVSKVLSKIKEAITNYSYLYKFFYSFGIKNENIEKKIENRIGKEVIECIKSIYISTNLLKKNERLNIIDYAKKSLKDKKIYIEDMATMTSVLDKKLILKYTLTYKVKKILKKIIYFRGR